MASEEDIEEKRDKALGLVKLGRFGEALPLLLAVCESRPTDSNALYLIGQCHRFLGDLDDAILYLACSVGVRSDDPPVFLALGIALQLSGQFAEAINALARAIELDSDYALAYNSLALTQKKMDDIEKALHNYDAVAKALARGIVKAMGNDPSNPINSHRNTRASLWTEYALFGALYLASMDSRVARIAWPTGEQALEEERTRQHGGLYYTDRKAADSGVVRLFLPNYFNTFREALLKDNIYADLMGNRGAALQVAGRDDEADQHFREAAEFMPPV
jgi:tetratricopeptide (TPR) repeat protein